MPVRQVSPWWRYWVFSKRHGSNHSCFCRVMGCSQSGAKQEGFEGMSARDCRCWDAESWSSPQSTWKCLALHVIRMIGWLDDWTYQMNGCQRTMLDCLWPKKPLVFHPTILLTDRFFALNMWQAVSAQGHNYKAPLCEGGGARPKIVNIPSFHLEWKCQGVSLWSSDMLSFVLTLVSSKERPPGQFPSLGATWVKGHYQAGWCWGEFGFDIMGDWTYSKHHGASPGRRGKAY